jgi:hypothetical protein
MKQIMTFLNASKVSLRIGDVTLLHKGSLDLFKEPSFFETALKKEIKNPAGKFNIKLKLLPNVSKFQVILGSFNPLLAAFGFQTRFGSKKRAIEGRNGRNNRYLCYMYYRLMKATDNPRLYWKISELLIMRSNVYLVTCLHHQSKNLYRSFTFDREVKLIQKLNQLRAHHSPLLKAVRDGSIDGATLMDPLIKIFRTYIPKGDGRYRPLGVPTVAWRIFAAMWLLPLNGFYPVTRSQHGFIPGRGTLTAWHSVMNFVLPSRNIYEIDFKGYFPSVNASAICGHLETLGLPKGISNFFLDMGLTPPDPKTVDPSKADEISNMVKIELDAIGLLRNNIGPGYKFTLPTFCLAEDGSYKGYVLKDLLNQDRDSLISEMREALGSYQTIEKAELQPESPPAKVGGIWAEDDAVITRLLKLMKQSQSFEVASLITNSGGINNFLSLLLAGGPLTDIPFIASAIKDSPNYFKSVVKTILDSRTGKSAILSDTLVPNATYKMVLRTVSEWVPLSLTELQSHWYEYLYEFYQYKAAIAESAAPLNPALDESPVLSHLKLDHKGEVATQGFEAHYNVLKTPVVEGLPQGSSLSPFLSMIYFNHFMTQLAKGFPNIHYVAYADDVIFYSDNDTEFDSFISSLPGLCSHYGLAVALNKSQISKLSGVWQSPRLKFLGLVYDTINSVLFSETRSGRHLVWEFTELTSILDILRKGKANVINGIKISRSRFDFYSTHRFMYEYFFMKTILSGPYGPALLHYLELMKNISLFNKRILKKFMTYRVNFGKNVAKYNTPTNEFLILLQYLLTQIPYFKNWSTKEGQSLAPKMLEGVYGGLLQSRLYLGSVRVPSFNTSSGGQNFKLFYKTADKDYSQPGTLAHILKSMLGSNMNVFNGSTIATYELVRFCSLEMTKGLPYSVGSNAKVSWSAYFERLKYEERMGFVEAKAIIRKEKAEARREKKSDQTK